MYLNDRTFCCLISLVSISALLQKEYMQADNNINLPMYALFSGGVSYRSKQDIQLVWWIADPDMSQDPLICHSTEAQLRE